MYLHTYHGLQLLCKVRLRTGINNIEIILRSFEFESCGVVRLHLALPLRTVELVEKGRAST